jgi:hypothetical protein
MAIGISASSLSLSSSNLGQGGVNRSPTDSSGGLRGLASLGTGLRTGLTVVHRATVTAGELSEARARASEALAEQARLERENDQAQEAVVQAELHPADLATDTAAHEDDNPVAPRTVDAAVVAGSSGEVAPRGAFVDLSV